MPSTTPNLALYKTLMQQQIAQGIANNHDAVCDAIGANTMVSIVRFSRLLKDAQYGKETKTRYWGRSVTLPPKEELEKQFNDATTVSKLTTHISEVLADVFDNPHVKRAKSVKDLNSAIKNYFTHYKHPDTIINEGDKTEEKTLTFEKFDLFKTIGGNAILQQLTVDYNQQKSGTTTEDLNAKQNEYMLAQEAQNQKNSTPDPTEAAATATLVETNVVSTHATTEHATTFEGTRVYKDKSQAAAYIPITADDISRKQKELFKNKITNADGTILCSPEAAADVAYAFDAAGYCFDDHPGFLAQLQTDEALQEIFLGEYLAVRTNVMGRLGTKIQVDGQELDSKSIGAGIAVTGLSATTHEALARVSKDFNDCLDCPPEDMLSTIPEKTVTAPQVGG